MSVEIVWLGHASVMVRNASTTVFIDPWKISDRSLHADIILLTHDHYDHFSRQDIELLSDGSTRIAAPMSTPPVTDVISPGTALNLCGINVEAVPAYNIDKGFHPRAKGWVGYILEIDGKRIYHAGDTDRIPEMIHFTVDLALVPVGGTYTMNTEEAAAAIEDIQARDVIPIHFGDIVGTSEDGRKLARISKRRTHVLSPGESYTLT